MKCVCCIWFICILFMIFLMVRSVILSVWILLLLKVWMFCRCCVRVVVNVFLVIFLIFWFMLMYWFRWLKIGMLNVFLFFVVWFLKIFFFIFIVMLSFLMMRFVKWCLVFGGVLMRLILLRILCWWKSELCLFLKRVRIIWFRGCSFGSFDLLWWYYGD